jgi:hypothetical protein
VTKAGIYVAILAGACMVSATTIIPMSVERLTRESSHVIEGAAAESWAQWNSQHTFIYTYTRFQVATSLKGNATSTVVVKQIGGSSDGYTQKVAGVRQWYTGEQAVLFLRPTMDLDGTFEVTGLIQGNFLVHTLSTGERVVSNGVPGVASYSASANRVREFRGNSMHLQDLEQRVRQAATNQ